MKHKIHNFGKTLAKIRHACRPFRATAVTAVAEKSRDPFRVLISCLISLRTKDEVTGAASRRLFAKAGTPAKMLRLREREIAKLIFPAGFYRTKAQRIREISQTLVNRYKGRVPDTEEGLLQLNGVGRKTANLVLTVAYGKPGICVDSHVHRLSNRLGWVKTKTPEQTELALRKILPKRYWIPLNDWLVTFGQNICQPVSPWCSKCPLQKDCPQIGVRYRR
jgi:endonuclease-3